MCKCLERNVEMTLTFQGLSRLEGFAIGTVASLAKHHCVKAVIGVQETKSAAIE